jgi:hypothetical protein
MVLHAMEAARLKKNWKQAKDELQAILSQGTRDLLKSAGLGADALEGLSRRGSKSGEEEDGGGMAGYGPDADHVGDMNDAMAAAQRAYDDHMNDAGGMGGGAGTGSAPASRGGFGFGYNIVPPGGFSGPGGTAEGDYAAKAGAMNKMLADAQRSNDAAGRGYAAQFGVATGQYPLMFPGPGGFPSLILPGAGPGSAGAAAGAGATAMMTPQGMVAYYPGMPFASMASLSGALPGIAAPDSQATGAGGGGGGGGGGGSSSNAGGNGRMTPGAGGSRPKPSPYEIPLELGAKEKAATGGVAKAVRGRANVAASSRKPGTAGRATSSSGDTGEGGSSGAPPQSAGTGGAGAAAAQQQQQQQVMPGLVGYAPYGYPFGYMRPGAAPAGGSGSGSGSGSGGATPTGMPQQPFNFAAMGQMGQYGGLGATTPGGVSGGVAFPPIAGATGGAGAGAQGGFYQLPPGYAGLGLQPYQFAGYQYTAGSRPASASAAMGAGAGVSSSGSVGPGSSTPTGSGSGSGVGLAASLPAGSGVAAVMAAKAAR